ncbi:MAG: ABC transporter substrate-binding protein, partial [Spirochaetae bacterium HGW-Spirochaetae-6]
MKKITALLAAMVLSLGLVSCGGSGSDTIKVGVLAPTSVFFGQMVVEGIQMAIAEVNEQGGILGKKVEAVIINDEDKADVGTLGLTKAIESDKIDVILGGVNSGVVLACMEVMAKYKKLWLGTGGASTKVVQNVKDDYEKYKYYFRVGTIDAALQG